MTSRRVRIASCLLLSLSLSLPLARAGDLAPKASDVQTIGGVTSVVTSAPAVLAPAPLVATAPAPIARAPLPPEPAQVAKLAELFRERAAQLAPSLPPEGKLPNFSSSSPERLPDVGAIAAAPGPTPRWRAFAPALGPLPRPEWGTGREVKPASVATVGPPTGLDHATVAPREARHAPIAREPDVVTSHPRDPSAPSPSPTKPTTVAPRPEERR